MRKSLIMLWGFSLSAWGQGGDEMERHLRWQQKMMEEQFEQMERMMDRFQRQFKEDPFFQDFFKDPAFGLGPSPEQDSPIAIAEELLEDRIEITITFKEGKPIPLKTSFEAGLLKISGEREFKQGGSSHKIHFERVIGLPEGAHVSAAKISAIEGGMRIVIPRQTAQPGTPVPLPFDKDRSI